MLEAAIYKPPTFACKAPGFVCANILTKIPARCIISTRCIFWKRKHDAFKPGCIPLQVIASYLYKLHWQFSLGVILFFISNLASLLYAISTQLFALQLRSGCMSVMKSPRIHWVLFIHSPLLPKTSIPDKMKQREISNTVHYSKSLILHTQPLRLQDKDNIKK